MRAEIIAVGTELLLGEVLNTNAHYLSSRCAELGIDVYHHITVGDNFARLCETLSVGRERSDLLLVTGGLGPTADDISREATAAAWGRPLVTDPDLLDRIRTYFCNRTVEMTANNESQAQMPEGAIALENHRGTAPGFYLADDVGSVACLPGPPGELRAMFEEALLPLLRSRDLIPETRLFSREILTAGIGESTVADKLADLIDAQTQPTIALYSGTGTVRVRLTTRAADAEEANETFVALQGEIGRRIGEYIYGYDGDSLSASVGRDLRERGLTIALAESCTGGSLSGMLTDAAGASDYFLGAIVSYSNAAKEDLLGVPQSLMIEWGAVSEPVAGAMAEGARDVLGADIGISVTGVAGPGGGTEEKPVGTVCFGFSGPWGTETEGHFFTGDRAGVRRRSTIYALVGLRRRLSRPS